MRIRNAISSCAVALLCATALTACTSARHDPGSLSEWTPADQGLVTWNYDPSDAGVTWNPTARTNGCLFLTAVLLRSPATLTHVLYGLSGAQTTGLTPGQNLIGLYGSDGTLLAQTADQTALWSDPARQRVNRVPWTKPYRAAPGRYYVAFLYNGVTAGLNFKASGAGMTANAGAPAGLMRYSMIKGHFTSLPDTAPPARQTTPLPFNSQWIGLD
ncbi:MAG: hypothetical protein HOY76_38475 [Streptomyces sp.]|nr:hypothetical protein [Streptomyces sp.]NUS10932.1 hypothetical protein [Streptomyces sp.]